MTDEPNDVARWAAMQDAVNARGAENRERAKQHVGASPLNADGSDLRGQAKRNRENEAQRDALDAIQKRREEDALTSEVRGEMEFARCLGAAPGLVAAFEKLKGQGRA